MKHILALIISTLLLFFGTAFADVLIEDTFEDYNVDRNTAGSADAFLTINGGKWDWARALNFSGSTGGNGYLYTVTSIPGFTGSFPGVNSTKVLAIELGGGVQTNTYLQFGDSEQSVEVLPGSVWFQYWVYINYSGDQLSQIADGNKFLYPCNAAYPCQTGKWIGGLGGRLTQPWCTFPYGAPTEGHAFVHLSDNQVGTVSYDGNPECDWAAMTHRLSQNEDYSTHVAPNGWFLVKQHFDTSTTSGSWKAWIKPQGGQFVQVANWVDGVTPDFVWSIPVEHVGGHRGLRWPTTTGGVEGTYYPAWIYVDDFVIAESESDLPTYGDENATCDSSHLNLCDQTECGSLSPTHYWCDGACQATPCSPLPVGEVRGARLVPIGTAGSRPIKFTPVAPGSGKARVQ